MRRPSRIAFAFVVLVFCSVWVHADSIGDPKIVIADPACPPGGCTSAGLNFSFSSPTAGSGSLFFTNTSGVNWFNLQFTETTFAANLISCQTDAFASCVVTAAGNGATILLSGITDCFRGITAGSNFVITFSCVGNSCWPTGTGNDVDFTATANVPEPRSLILAFISIAGIALLLKKQKVRSVARMQG